jgi:hypothetical protein
MKSREEIISDMCHTWRHDYGLNKDPEDCLSSGMTETERKSIWCKMSQIYDRVFAPHIKTRRSNLEYYDND